MKNSTKEIGRKIREERLKKAMTQSELAGGVISRNMLSLIESGKALPSLETLEHIANVLDISAGYFMTESESESELYKKTDCISKARKLYSEKRYEECADICKSAPFDDETNALLAECCLGLCGKDMELFHLKSASSRLKSAYYAAKKSIYLSEDFYGTLEACEFFIGCAASDVDSDALGRIAKKPSRVPAGFFGFLAVLSYFDRGKADDALTLAHAFPYLTKGELRYLRAKEYIMEFKYSKALEILLELENGTEFGFITRYRIYADIESCFENRREFENAYKYSTKKHRMLEAFTK